MSYRQILLKAFSALLLTAAAAFHTASANPAVDTSLGVIEGVNEGHMDVFRGIPYAKPPIGDLRFAPPVKAEPFAYRFKADTFCPIFPQQGPLASRESQRISENSLCLNIYRPKDLKADDRLPVYVWIHGGGYLMGGSSNPLYDGRAFTHQGIILVTLNYRLNALGFYASKQTFSDYGTTGNWGHLDMVEALLWLKEHISSFGGDPDNITIGGESSGSMAVSSLILSKKAEGLFKRAILESGTILSHPFGSLSSESNKKSSFVNSATMASLFGADDTKAGLSLLRQVESVLLAYQTGYDYDFEKNTFSFLTPCFDGSFLPSDPYQAVKEGSFNHVDILIGYNTDEGAGFSDRDLDYEKFKHALFNRYGYFTGRRVFSIYRRAGYSDNESAYEAQSSYNADTMFNLGMKIFADALSKENRVYMYHFDYAPHSDVFDQAKVVHASEIQYAFFNLPSGASEEQRHVASVMNTLFANFIKTGEPSTKGLIWPLYDSDSAQVLRIGKTAKSETFELKERLEKLEEQIMQ
ncbi:MAG: carboxylesterase/lipase family protein [Succinivibrio sp.]